jgi:hypothetical protein
MLGSAEVSVSVVATAGSGWNAEANLIGASEDDREGFVFLCDLDPVFLLRFVGEGTVLVAVHDIQDGGRRFSLSEYRGPERRSIDHRIDV